MQIQNGISGKVLVFESVDENDQPIDVILAKQTFDTKGTFFF